MAEDVTILIDDEEFTSWPSVDITLSLDSLSSVGFTSPFDPGRAEFREVFRPFSFKPVEVRVAQAGNPIASPLDLGPLGSGDRVFNGTLVGVDPESDDSKRQVSVTAYALPGVLQDCTAPGASVPIEFDGLTFEDIAAKLLAPFQIGVDFQAPRGPEFNKAKLEVDQRIWDFLSTLARQQNFVLSNNADGELLCWQSASPGNPVATLEEVESPTTRVRATFSPQSYFSEVTGFVTARKRRKGKPARRGAKYTEDNPSLDVLRPLSFKVPDAEDAGAPEAARAKLARMFGNVASYEVGPLPTWRTPDGELWAPNTTITLTAPDAMIYNETEFLIRTVTLHQDANSETATLGLVLPGAFSGEIPEVFPWDG